MRPRTRYGAALRRFWLLVVVAVLATGVLTSALAADPGTATGLRVATAGTVLLVSGTLAARIMLALSHARSVSPQRLVRPLRRR